MKKILATIALTAILVFSLCGCNAAAKSFGGDITITLEPNQKLELITWKDDDSLWYLTRPMRENEEAETHVYQQDSEFGIFEGTVTIIEVKE
jgi:hypothetical protein